MLEFNTWYFNDDEGPKYIFWTNIGDGVNTYFGWIYRFKSLSDLNFGFLDPRSPRFMEDRYIKRVPPLTKGQLERMIKELFNARI